MHDFEKVADYVKLKLGAPIVDIDLTDPEVAKCVDTAAELIVSQVIAKKVNASAAYLDRKLQEGSVAIAKYLAGKRKFARSFQHFTFFSGPEKDGWDLMCEGSGEWDKFKESLKQGQ